jgi:hypothetical protein
MEYSDNHTKVQISAPTYWGFNIDFPNNKIIRMSEKDIIEEMKVFMKTFFKIHNLEELKQGVDNLNLHIHGKITIGETIYLCDHE